MRRSLLEPKFDRSSEERVQRVIEDALAGEGGAESNSGGQLYSDSTDSDPECDGVLYYNSDSDDDSQV